MKRDVKTLTSEVEEQRNKMEEERSKMVSLEDHAGQLVQNSGSIFKSKKVSWKVSELSLFSTCEEYDNLCGCKQASGNIRFPLVTIHVTTESCSAQISENHSLHKQFMNCFTNKNFFEEFRRRSFDHSYLYKTLSIEVLLNEFWKPLLTSSFVNCLGLHTLLQVSDTRRSRPGQILVESFDRLCWEYSTSLSHDSISLTSSSLRFP